jgi:putative nucleotidyltransferase with HDIG domain
MSQRQLHILLASLALLITALLLFPAHEAGIKSEIPRLGEITRKSYVAPITFDIPKSPPELEDEKSKARDKVLYLFEYNHDRTRMLKERFEKFMDNISRYSHLQTILATSSDTLELRVAESNAADIFQKISRQVSTTAINQMAQNVAARDSLASAFQNMLDLGVSNTLLAINDKQVSLYKSLHNLNNLNSLIYNKPEIALIRANTEERLETANLTPKEAAVDREFNRLQITFPKSQALQSAFFEVLYAFTEPNVYFLDKETKLRQEAEANAVRTTKGKIIKGMEVLPAGAIVTREAIEKLIALQNAQMNEDSSLSSYFPRLGQWLVLIGITLAVLFFFYFYRSHVFKTPKQIWTISLVLVFQIFGFYITRLFESYVLKNNFHFFSEPIELIQVYPFLIAAILATVLFNLEIGILAALYTSLYLGMMNGMDLSLVLACLMVSFAAIWMLQNIRYRSQFIFAWLNASGAFLVAFFVRSMLSNQLNFDYLLPNITVSILSILITVALSSLVLIPLFEKLSGITTNLSLMELADFNHPALKLISVETPSTFHHSIMVGNLAEKAVEEIGANALLARVMALYHDIGKTLNPDYFTENQKGYNRHDELTPEESAQYIIDHVEKAQDLAEKLKLPQLVRAGIPEHHGTSIIHFFYKKACDLYGKENVNPEHYRYKGPRPQSKETAALMLADAIEATSRSLKNPDSAALIQLVQNVIRARLQENQLSDCQLTLADLKKLERGFLKALEGMHHTRIQYPKDVFFQPES